MGDKNKVCVMPHLNLRQGEGGAHKAAQALVTACMNALHKYVLRLSWFTPSYFLDNYLRNNHIQL